MILFIPKYAQSVEKHSNGNGLWQNAATWSPSSVPTCGDTIIVDSGDTVTMDNQNDYTGCGSAIVLDVSGVLQITNGNKLLLPCSSIVSIQFGGLLRKATAGGGTSTLLSLCSDTLWRADDGPQSGPLSWGGWILPIELVQFSVEQDEYNNEIIAHWTTASETSNDFFTLSASCDGSSWVSILNVQGAGYSNKEIEYHKYLELNSANRYVRLCQTDFDGKETQLGIVAIARPDEQKISFQNPNSGSFYIRSQTALASVIEIRGADSRLLMHSALKEEYELIRIDEVGIFFLSIYDKEGDLIESHRVIVQPY